MSMSLPLDVDTSSWVEHAACRGLPTAWWYSAETSIVHAMAMRLCKSCPVSGACLAEANRIEGGGRYHFGIRGGLDAAQRRAQF